MLSSKNSTMKCFFGHPENFSLLGSWDRSGAQLGVGVSKSLVFYAIAYCSESDLKLHQSVSLNSS